MDCQRRAYNILVFMGFKPMISGTNFFPACEISKQKALKIQALMGFKPITKYFTASEISEKKAYQIIKRAKDYQRRKPTTLWLLWDSNPWTWKQNIFQLMKYQKRALKKESLQHSGFHGIQTHDLWNKIFSSLWNIKRESLINSGFDGIQTHNKIF